MALRRVCEHAYQRTRRDLLKRRHELEPVLARHGIGLRLDVLRDDSRRLGAGGGGARHLWPAGSRLPGATADLRGTLVDLRRWLVGGQIPRACAKGSVP